jgi:RNA polymerase subunit RPABC4/transcription elongation factor Spt4
MPKGGAEDRAAVPCGAIISEVTNDWRTTRVIILPTSSSGARRMHIDDFVKCRDKCRDLSRLIPKGADYPVSIPRHAIRVATTKHQKSFMDTAGYLKKSTQKSLAC